MSQHYYKFGEKGSGFRAPSADAIQDYQQLKDSCISQGKLFEDPVFPAIQSSLYYSSHRGQEYKWLRPSEITNDPKFFIQGASRFDVKQGELGDCWLLAAIANVTLNNVIFNRVVPTDQLFSDDDYAGIFHFHLWRYGKWIDIVVDDRLPTVNGRLVFMHSVDSNEFWSALLEKAYAKLHGSYEALKGGTACEAMEDFTGGVTEYYELNSPDCPPNLFDIMLKGFERSSFMGCSIDALDSSQMEAELANGLIRGHAYSVTSVKYVEIKTSRVAGKIPLLRIRNPWGNEAEWKGSWSDKSKEWSVISEEEKIKLELTFDSDGEFWMSFPDFKSNFTRLEICNLNPEPLVDAMNPKKKWEATHFHGAWVSGVSAGGCRNNLNTFALNPQYIVKLTDFDENDSDDLCTLLVALMQKNRRAKRRMGLDALTIGFAIYAIKDGHFVASDEPVYATKFKKQLLTTEYFKYNASVARSPNFINLREICSRFRLPQGTYCIIPSTFDSNEEGEYLLRIFSEQPPGYVTENDDEVGMMTPSTIPKGVPDDSLPSEVEEETIRFRKNGDGDDDDIIDDDGKKKTEPSDPSPVVAADSSNKAFTQTARTVLNLLLACWTLVDAAKEQVASKAEEKQDLHAKQAEASVHEFFAKIAGEDMEVDPAELQEILNHALKKDFKFDGFSLDSCRSMVALLDEDKSGMLGMDEFSSLWRSVRQWCTVFRKFDVDNSSSINASELRSALSDIGLTVNRRVLQQLVQRYGIITSGKKGDIKVERTLSFDAFICCCIKLKNCIDTWNEQLKHRYSRDATGQNLPSFTIDEWVEKVMYC